MAVTTLRCPRWCTARAAGHDRRPVRHYGRTHVLHTSPGGRLAVEVSQPVDGGPCALAVIVTQDGDLCWHDAPLPRLAGWLVDWAASRIAGRWARRRP